ncbi:DUF1343 domain-containing protein [Chryseobacterium salipaludis]|uniref:exo-beta-N-acetylmuramidase NamZ family protein n=1 Tax=Chryseobacterium TaxID=59732 RepID=UPI001FF5B63E|nr:MULTISPECIES: DUF1343 domain-containing protein [Chryseobacterium]MCJ8496893.1 DUF1343 domain-containing protein [Chryseobacterium salipaludis]MCX3296374.1 DUF1343 domain-containing protein [Planobacterium sp. JC490]
MEKYSGKFNGRCLTAKIKDLLLILLIYFGAALHMQAQQTGKNCFQKGADRPALYLPLLAGKKVGIVTNHTGVMQDKQHVVDFLLKNGISVTRIFAPEHGFRGEADAGEQIRNGRDTATGLPIISLYGKNKKPSRDQVEDLDVILFDIQDVGVRFYTYISTLAYVMEAAAENQVAVIVLDRPNPHDGYTDGPVLQSGFESFVGMHPVPVVYGLTIGEYGKMVNGEKWLANGIQADYTVIPMLNYHKTQRYPIDEKPSPNLPNAQSIVLYPSLCFFEGTQVSVGRGTALPFQVYGSPWTKSLPYTFTPRPTAGAKDPFLNGKLCYGENLSAPARDLRQLELQWLLKAYQAYNNPSQSFFLKNLFFDKLAGTDELRKQIISGKSENEIRKSWQKGLADFERIRQRYVIYPD